jgi:ribonuclease BN (tRNA processing enzyme)
MMGANFEFLTYGDKETIFGASVRATPQHHLHSGGSYGYRIDDESVSLVMCTDVEHINGIDENVVNLAKGADLLIHDGQYTAKLKSANGGIVPGTGCGSRHSGQGKT